MQGANLYLSLGDGGAKMIKPRAKRKHYVGAYPPEFPGYFQRL